MVCTSKPDDKSFTHSKQIVHLIVRNPYREVFVRLDKAYAGGLGDIGDDITEHTIEEDDTKGEDESCHDDSGHCYPGH